MERIIDKVIALIFCCVVMVLAGTTTQMLVGLLVAISFSALFELPKLPWQVQAISPSLYAVLALFFPDFVVFLPLAAGDAFRLVLIPLRFTWLVPLATCIVLPERGTVPIELLCCAALFCVLSCLMVWRSGKEEELLRASRMRRDDLAKASRSLEMRNRDLRERQEMELHLATLNERSRIAREIHDNVGHLLTRSVLQVEALSVVHAGDEQLTEELKHVSGTLNTAFESVRASVHDLHEESYDLEVQLGALAKASEGVTVQVDYRVRELPSNVAYSFLSIVREALSNTRRHSDATGMQISVVEFPGLYQLTAHDNGSRAPLKAALTQGEGIGLTTMEERARSLGGIFRTSYDKGFKVFVSVPKSKTASAETE